MARKFDSGNSEYLSLGRALLDSPPLTMDAWVYVTNLTAVHDVIALGNTASGFPFCHLLLSGLAGGDPVRMAVRDDALNTLTADTPVAYLANTWMHVCGIWAGASDARVFLYGGNKGTDVAAVIGAITLNSTAIAARLTTIVSGPLNGYVAEAVIRRAALTDSEVAVLPYVPPWKVRRSRIVGYWPERRSITVDRDISGRGNHMTPINTPTWAPHPQRAQKYWFDWEMRKRRRWPTKGLSPIVTRIPRHPAHYNPYYVV